MNFQQIRRLNAWTAAITRPHRLTYARTYPTVLVQPDGSTYTIRYPEPRCIIKVSYTLNKAQYFNKLFPAAFKYLVLK